MTSIIERVDAAVKRLRDPKRPTKCLRIGQEHFALLSASVDDKRRAQMQAEFVMPNGIVCPPGPLGHWDGMRFVVVNGANDLDEVTT